MVDSFRIERCILKCRVSRESNLRPTVTEAALRRGLAREMARIRGDREGVWRIRSLRVRAVSGAEWTSDQVAAAVSQAISKALQTTLDAGPDGEDVLWYPSRAAYLGRFMTDCAVGRAFGYWPYQEFEKWSGLSTSGALREAMSDEPAAAREALANLLPGELKTLLREVSPQDAELVLRALAPPNNSETDALRTALDAFHALFSAGPLPFDRRTLALEIFIEALRVGAQVSPGASENLATLAVALRRRSPAEAERLAFLLAASDFRGLIHEFGAPLAADLAPLAGWSASIRQEVVREVAARFKGEAGRKAEGFETRLGGAVLLLPLLSLFPWPDDWPALHDVPGAAVLRFLTLVAALGRPHNRAALGDPLLRLACGIPPELGAADFAAWSKAIPRGAANRLRTSWLESLRARDAIAEDSVRVGFAPGRTVAIETRRGVWLSAEPSRKRPGEAHSLAKEWSFATVDPILGLSRPVVELLRMNGQTLLREFAWRLPGFSGSSLPYLYQNFLDFKAVAELEAERILVRMDNPSLHFILAMNGMNRQSFALPATGGRLWVLTQRF